MTDVVSWLSWQLSTLLYPWHFHPDIALMNLCRAEEIVDGSAIGIGCKEGTRVSSCQRGVVSLVVLIGLAQDETLSQNEVYGRYTKPVFGPDVVYNSEPKKRNQQMQHMSYGLRTARLKAYVPMIEKETRAFLKTWGDSVRLTTFMDPRV